MAQWEDDFSRSLEVTGTSPPVEMANYHIATPLAMGIIKGIIEGLGYGEYGRVRHNPADLVLPSSHLFFFSLLF
ncbi:MAG: hypothetical protein NTU41_08535 [Chloroflexi bacterium]|nr:hypothetical protein [Chloroflexota bacterium]